MIAAIPPESRVQFSSLIYISINEVAVGEDESGRDIFLSTFDLMGAGWTDSGLHRIEIWRFSVSGIGPFAAGNGC